MTVSKAAQLLEDLNAATVDKTFLVTIGTLRSSGRFEGEGFLRLRSRSCVKGGCPTLLTLPSYLNYVRLGEDVLLRNDLCYKVLVYPSRV